MHCQTCGASNMMTTPGSVSTAAKNWKLQESLIRWQSSLSTIRRFHL